MSGGLVSVVMPAFEEEAFIAEALRSVLAQTYRPVELIVVDDGSGDRTAEIAAAHEARVLRRPHRGAAAACNAGLTLARGDYWTIFDADDVMAPERLSRQVAHLEQHPELGIVLGLTEAFVSPGEPRPPHYNLDWDDGPFPACTGTVLARRAVLDLVGPFDETRELCYDLDWLARAKDAGVCAGQVDHVALRYRIHRANATSDARAVNLAMLKVLRESLHRRGALRAHD
jgi:glycosyltransferase involved in cell wall biosynthesis